MKSRSLVSLFAAAALFALAHTTGSAQIVGGFRDVSVEDSFVVKAADFAVEEQAKTERFHFIEIVEAKQQVVAGINYKLTLSVKKRGKVRQVEAVVWMKTDRTYELTSWTWEPEE